ncbi:flavoprotein [Streptomyces achromogenes]|uniref:flavoprotein n=1 Tax=Streptomyces achromogenes TaxID=67255 RepID=UPI0036BF277F
MTAPAPRQASGALDVPPLGVSRLLLVITGSAAASGMPQWLTWIRAAYPELRLKVVMSPSARRFVTPLSLALRLDEEVAVDAWEECDRARHIEHAEWAEAALVYPATFHFTARLALGLADSPALLTLQCTEAPVAIAPSLPPGGLDSPAFRSHWAALAARPQVVLVPPVQGHSLTTGREDSWVPPPLPDALRRLEERRAALAAAHPDTGHTSLLADGDRS